MSEILKLQTNIPETIALEYAKGMPVPSNYGGDEFMYTLTDGRKFFAKPFVASLIDGLGVGKREPFQITKREEWDGQRRTVRYQVRRQEDVAAEAIANTPAIIRNSTPAKLPITTVTREAAKDNASRAAVQQGDQTLPNSQHAQVVSQPTQQPNTQCESRLELALRLAIDAAANAETYAKSKDYALRFTSEDLRAMGLSLYIAMDRGGAKWQN